MELKRYILDYQVAGKLSEQFIHITAISRIKTFNYNTQIENKEGTTRK